MSYTHANIATLLSLDPTSAQNIHGLISESIPATQYLSAARLARASRVAPPSDIFLILVACSEVLQGYGVTPIAPEGAHTNSKLGSIVAHYVDRGSSPTVLWDYEARTFTITTPHEWLKDWESRR